MLNFLPEQASEIAPKIDWLNNLITDLSVFFTVAIVGSMIYFAIRYREKDGKPHPTPQITGSHTLEMIWTIVPTIICIIIAYYGVAYYHELRSVPADALTINVKAQKWKWDFEYDTGKNITNEFYVPVDKHVKLVLRSRDVLHSLFIPAMRTKSDALPSRYTYVAFKPVKTGTYNVFCTEYCGQNHSMMLAKIHVVSEDEYSRWVNDKSDEIMKSRMGPSERGRILYQQKGCNACHSLDGSRVLGPSFLKVWAKDEKMASGQTMKVDENYVHRSLIEPNADIVEGFPPNVMPSFKGQLSDDDISDIIAFIKSIDGTNAEAKAGAAQPAAQAADLSKLSPAERGKALYQSKTCVACHSLDGSSMTGPSFKGVYGRQEKMTDGSTVTVDDAYLSESIKVPTAKVVNGFAPVMPPLGLSDAEIKDITEFLKTVK